MAPAPHFHCKQSAVLISLLMAPVLSKKLSSLKSGKRKFTRPVAPTSHTTAQWNDIKPVFTKLYIDEDRKLEEVRAILGQRHAFFATQVNQQTKLSFF